MGTGTARACLGSAIFTTLPAESPQVVLCCAKPLLKYHVGFTLHDSYQVPCKPKEIKCCILISSFYFRVFSFTRNYEKLADKSSS